MWNGGVYTTGSEKEGRAGQMLSVPSSKLSLQLKHGSTLTSFKLILKSRESVSVSWIQTVSWIQGRDVGQRIETTSQPSLFVKHGAWSSRSDGTWQFRTLYVLNCQVPSLLSICLSKHRHRKLLHLQCNCFPPCPSGSLLLLLPLFICVCSYDMGWVGIPCSFEVPEGGAVLCSPERKQCEGTERPRLLCPDSGVYKVLFSCEKKHEVLCKKCERLSQSGCVWICIFIEVVKEIFTLPPLMIKMNASALLLLFF